MNLKLIRRQTITVAVLCVTAPIIAHDVHGQGPFCPPVQIQRLMPPCGEIGAFGTALSLNDYRLAVGGELRGTGGRVRTFLLNQTSGRWEFEADVRPSDLHLRGAGFGSAVKLHHDALTDEWLLAVGSRSRDIGQPRAGSSFIFALDQNGQWILQTEVLPEIPVSRGYFGTELTWATVGERTFLVVGAPGNTDPPHPPGAVYVFEQDGTGMWKQQVQLDPPNGGQPDGAFGYGIGAAEGNGVTILALGEPVYRFIQFQAPGTIYFYRFDTGNDAWVLEDQFQAPDPYESDLFGWSVSVGVVRDEPGITHRAVVGRPNEGALARFGRGAAYVYARRDDGSWFLEGRIEPPPMGPAADQMFGNSVDLERDGASEVLISATGDRRFGRYSGSAYLVRRDAATGSWTTDQALYGRKEDRGDTFGLDLALGIGASAGTAIVGAPATLCLGEPGTPVVGAVYAFDLDPADGNGVCPAPVLTVQKVPDCSMGRGGELEVRWFQATPGKGARIAILYAKRLGNMVIPAGNPCAGTQLGLGALGLQLAFTGSGGPFGAGRVMTQVPRSICGDYLQLIDIKRCITSNTVRIE